MAKIGEEMTFTSECATKLYRLPIVSGGDLIFVNTGFNSVSSVMASDQKLVQTWTLSHPKTFTCPVAFCHEDDTLCCIADDEILMNWTQTTTKLKKATKVKLPLKAFSVLSLPECGCFAVFTSGVVLPVEKIIEDSQLVMSASQPNLSGELIWADMLRNKSNGEIIFVFVTSKKKKLKVWSYRWVQDDLTLEVICSYKLTKKNVKLLSWCTGWSTKTPVFIASWSNGEIESYELDAEGDPTMICSLPEVDDTFSIVVETLDGSHLAVVKNKNHTKKGAVLEIWDLRYKTRKARQALKRTISKHFQMRALMSKLYISVDGGVMVIPVELEASTLSAVVGRATSSICDTDAVCYEWNSDGELCESNKKEEKKSTERLKITSEMLKEKLDEMSTTELKDYCLEVARQRDISESELVKMVRFALINSKGLEFVENADEETLEDRKDFIVLCAVFSIKFSDIFLRHHLKKLNSDETVMCLRFLLFLLNSRLFAVKDDNDAIPNDLQILCWFQLLIESHFEDLLMSNDLEILSLLKNIRRDLSEKINIYGELNQISHLLKISKKNGILPEKYTEAEYSFEFIYY